MPLVTGKIMGNATQQLAFTVPATFPWGSMNLVAANQNNQASAIQIHITTDQAPNAVDCVEPGASIPANGRYELSCRLVMAGEKIYVTAAAGVSVRIEVNMADEV